MKGSTAPKVFLTFAIVFILFAAVTALISILGKPPPALLSINKIDYAVSPTIKVFAEPFPYTADLNNDCKINFGDFSILGEHWLERAK